MRDQITLREVLAELPDDAEVRIVILFKPIYQGKLSTFRVVAPELEKRWKLKNPDQPAWMERGVIDAFENAQKVWHIYVSRWTPEGA